MTVATALRVVVVMAMALRLGALDVEAHVPWADQEGVVPVIVTVSGSSGPARLRAEGGENYVESVVQVPSRTTLLLPVSSRRLTTITVDAWAEGAAPVHLGISPDHEAGGIDIAVVHPDGAVVAAVRAAVSSALPTLSTGPRFSRYRGSGAYDPGQRIVPLAAQDVPERWQGLPDWLALVVSPDGERSLTLAQRTALARWSQGGGHLLVTTSAQVPAWQATGARLRVLDSAQVAPLITTLQDQDQYRVEVPPIPGLSGVPVGWFVIIAVLFTVVAGPVNVFVLARGHRPRLLITTPIISAATCAVLLVGGVLADGLGTTRRLTQVMLIDSATHQAATWSSVALLSGLPTTHLALDPDERVRRAGSHAFTTRWEPSDGSLGLSMTPSFAATGDWLPARRHVHWQVQTVRPERRRLLWDHGQIRNGFEVPLREVWQQRADGGWLVARQLAPGGLGTLTATTDAPPAIPVQRLGPDLHLPRGPQVLLARTTVPVVPLPGPPAHDAIDPEVWIVTETTP